LKIKDIQTRIDSVTSLLIRAVCRCRSHPPLPPGKTYQQLAFKQRL